MAMRRELASVLAPLRRDALADHPWRGWAEQDAAAKNAPAGEAAQRMPGATSRWSAGKDLAWQPLRPERVCEVKYDHLQGDRFRHATTFVRWRPDKPPEACRYDQLEVVAPYALKRDLRRLRRQPRASLRRRRRGSTSRPARRPGRASARTGRTSRSAASRP